MFTQTARFIIPAGFLVLSACSPNTISTPEIVSEPTPVPSSTPLLPTAEPTEPPPPPMQLPDTSVTAQLGVEPNTTYKVNMASFEALPFEDEELPAEPGSVTAQWYTSGGRFVVAYVGLDLANAESLCPGNSILTDAGFQNVSNAPTEEGACQGFTTMTNDPEVGPIVCQGTLLYVTAIPSEQHGTLFGTLEKLGGEGSIVGMTSMVESSSDIPEINLDDLCP